MNALENTQGIWPNVADRVNLPPKQPPLEKTASVEGDRVKTEAWLPVRGHEKDYEVSSIGRIRRISPAVWTTRKRTDSPGHTTYGSATSHGYRAATIRKPDGCLARRYIHRVVAEAFLPNPQQLPQVNHKDGNRANNSVSNLEWVTSRGNLLHRSRVLRKEVGESHHAAKLTDNDVCEIWRILAAGSEKSTYAIAARFRVDRKTVDHIIRGETWTHVPSGPVHHRYRIQKYSDDVVRALRKDRAAGMSVPALSRKYGCGTSHVQRLINGKSRRLVV